MTDSKLKSPKLAFAFFRQKAIDGDDFSLDEVTTATGWSAGTFTTYLPKQWKGLVEKTGAQRYGARREFLRLNESEFLNHITQNRPLFADYKRTYHDHVVTFEFLLPLTRETELRRALDALFYTDTIEMRLREVGINKLASILPRLADETDPDFLKRLTNEADRFGGYSISHVSGRFRAESLMTREKAGALLSEGGSYLVDESTASVRFIIPCNTGVGEFEDALYSLDNLSNAPPTLLGDVELEKEVATIRKLFFALFAEAVVRTVKGEDEIWLIEGGPCQKLYRWSQVK